MIQKEYTIRPISSGTSSWNTSNSLRGILYQININPSSTTTIYDFSITDDNGNKIYNKQGIRGIHNDYTQMGVLGIHTLAIVNSTVSTSSFTTTLLWDDEL